MLVYFGYGLELVRLLENNNILDNRPMNVFASVSCCISKRQVRPAACSRSSSCRRCGYLAKRIRLAEVVGLLGDPATGLADELRVSDEDFDLV